MEEERKYKINIGDFTVEENIYHNRCLSASFGGVGIESDVIPWEDTENNPWDYKYENNEFVLDPIEIPEPIPTPSQLDRVEAQTMWTALMTDTLLEEG